MVTISPALVSAQPIRQNTEVYIELLSEEPGQDLILDTARPPGLLLGYYNPIFNIVQLYVVGVNGFRMSRVS